jgi:hypothetical protein
VSVAASSGEMPKRLLTVAKLRAFRACPRLFKLRYIDRMEPIKKSEALTFGNLFHAGLNAWWNPALAPADRLDAALKALREYWQTNFRILDAWAGVTAEELIKAYDARWRFDDNVKPVDVEVAYDVPLVDETTGRESEWRRSGRMDLVVSVLVLDKYAVGEHKTSTEDLSPGSPYWTKLRVDTQVSEYMRGGAAHFGRPMEHVLYDVTLKPDISPLRATPLDKREYTKGKPCKKHATSLACANCDGSGWKEAPRLVKRQRDRDEHPEEWRVRLQAWMAKQPFLFARNVIPRLEHELVEADRDAMQTAAMIDSCHDTGIWPKTDTSCMAYGRPCDFRDVCLGVASLDDRTRYRSKTYDNKPQEDTDDKPEHVPDPDAYSNAAAVDDPDAELTSGIVDDPDAGEADAVDDAD